MPRATERCDAAELELSNAEAHRADTYAHAQWYIKDITIQDLSTILDRRTVPKDFAFPEFSSKYPYVEETYKYVRARIDLSKRLHQLAFIFGITFSKLSPTVFTDGRPAGASEAVRGGATKGFLDSIPWNSRNKTGRTRRNLYVSMVVTFILALYDDEGPGGKFHKASGAIGPGWTEKHSPKGVTPLNLVRLGILQGSNHRLLNSARFEDDYNLLTTDQIITLHKTMVDRFKELPCGPFALSFMVSLPKAKSIAIENYECILPDCYLNELSDDDRRRLKRRLKNKHDSDGVQLSTVANISDCDSSNDLEDGADMVDIERPRKRRR